MGKTQRRLPYHYAAHTLRLEMQWRKDCRAKKSESINRTVRVQSVHISSANSQLKPIEKIWRLLFSSWF
jgi:hypothetical protein